MAIGLRCSKRHRQVRITRPSDGRLLRRFPHPADRLKDRARLSHSQTADQAAPKQLATVNSKTRSVRPLPRPQRHPTVRTSTLTTLITTIIAIGTIGVAIPGNTIATGTLLIGTMPTIPIVILPLSSDQDNLGTEIVILSLISWLLIVVLFSTFTF